LVIWFSRPSTPSIGVPVDFASFNNASIVSGENASANRRAAVSSPRRGDVS
jgi:hypothetical protein